MTIAEYARRIAEAEFVEVRRSLHRIPELGFAEFDTAALIRQRLAAEGIPVVADLAGTGFVAAIRRGSSTRAIGLRADMDGLAVHEVNSFEYASAHQGVMHACGHDGHMAVLLAAATSLARHGNFDGTVYLIFQPAEEGGGGAPKMIEQGLFERFAMNQVFALHNWPGLPAGHVAASVGAVMASTNDFEVELVGPGGHAAFPQHTAPLVSIAAEIVRSFDGIIGSRMDPMTQAVLAVTQMAGGTTVNAYPASVRIAGTVRAFSHDTVDQIESHMEAIVQGATGGTLATGRLSLRRSYPPTVNHADAAAMVRRAADLALEPGALHEQVAAMTSEDFAFMLEQVPGAYFFLGSGDAAPLHSAHFDFPDEALPAGAAVLATLVEQVLAAE